jgi:hypothetical protein
MWMYKGTRRRARHRQMSVLLVKIDLSDVDDMCDATGTDKDDVAI